MGIRREAVATDLEAEIVEVLLVETPFEECSGIDAGGGVSLEIDVVAGIVAVLAAKEVVEPHLVQGGRRSKRREVSADALFAVVGLDHHHGRVPPNKPPDPPFQIGVAGILGLLFGRESS